MRRISIILMTFLLSNSIIAQSSYQEFEEDWGKDPLRFFVAEKRHTTVWTDIGDGNPLKSEKGFINGKVIIGVDNNFDISIMSQDGSIFHTYKIKKVIRDSTDITIFRDEIGEYVLMEFECEMYFSNLKEEDEKYIHTQLIYRLYTAGVFVVNEYSENKLTDKITLKILTSYIGKFKLEQVTRLKNLVIK